MSLRERGGVITPKFLVDFIDLTNKNVISGQFQGLAPTVSQSFLRLWFAIGKLCATKCQHIKTQWMICFCMVEQFQIFLYLPSCIPFLFLTKLLDTILIYWKNYVWSDIRSENRVLQNVANRNTINYLLLFDMIEEFNIFSLSFWLHIFPIPI